MTPPLIGLSGILILFMLLAVRIPVWIALLLQAPGDAVARGVELPVRRADQLAVRIDLEFQPPARFFSSSRPRRRPTYGRCALAARNATI